MDLQAAYAIAYNFPGALYILGRASWVSVRSHCAVLWLAIAAALTHYSESAVTDCLYAYTVGRSALLWANQSALLWPHLSRRRLCPSIGWIATVRAVRCASATSR